MISGGQKGFTLIELLVVLGILTVLLSIALAAISPFEQLNRTNDTTTKAIAQDFTNASIGYYASTQALPWDKDTACLAEMAPGKALADMPSCTHDLINSGKLESDYDNNSQLKDIFLTTCGKSAVICYSPKSKVEYEDVEIHYDKFGVNQPGCPGKIGTSPTCYWCKPILNDSQCLTQPTPTPTATPTPVPTVTPVPTLDYFIGGYTLDDPKFFRTYAVLAFTAPSFAPNWMVDVSMRPDFGGTASSGFGYFVNGVPVTSNADTIFNVAYAGDGNFGTLTSPSYAAQIKLTPKHFAFISMPYYWSQYVNGCGKPIYWRVVGWPGDSTGLIGPTYTSTIDCNTKVGVVSSWFDINNDGIVDWTDYIIESLQTRLRYGGWQPPE